MNVKSKRRQRNTFLLIRLSKAERLALNQAAAAEDVPASQVVRRGIKHMVAEIGALSNAKSTT